VRLAQRLLETSDLPVDAIAGKSGFGTADNLRKHFSRILQTTPQAYRRTFQAPAPRRLPSGIDVEKQAESPQQSKRVRPAVRPAAA
jgi:AraC-like DNA-binding protein